MPARIAPGGLRRINSSRIYPARRCGQTEPRRTCSGHIRPILCHPSKNSKYSAAHKSNKLVDPRAVAWLPAVPLRKGSVVFDVFLVLIRRRKASALPNHLGYQTLTPLRLNAVSGHSEYSPVPEPYGIVAHPALLRAETQDKLMARLAVDAHPANRIKLIEAFAPNRHFGCSVRLRTRIKPSVALGASLPKSSTPEDLVTTSPRRYQFTRQRGILVTTAGLLQKIAAKNFHAPPKREGVENANRPMPELF